MIDIKTFEFEAGHRFQEHPHFTYVVEDKLYMWRYDLQRKAMLNQCSGIDNAGKTLEEGLTELLGRRSDNNFGIINEQTISHQPGFFYPRIWRIGSLEDNFKSNGEPAFNNSILRQAVTTTSILIKKLLVIFETIEPNSINLDCYGHEIRNLLLLTCMEIETNLAGILRANDYVSARGDRMNTQDYVKLQEPLQLSEYTVKFEFYPDLNEYRPFENWNSGSPTQSIPWYDAYNKTKHNREQELSSASLLRAIESVSALLILLHAQFGPYHEFWNESPLSNILIKKPESIDIDKMYIPHNADKTKITEWQEMKMTF
ncbi:hypothetical protein [uncultured Tenacibaculum sp.]|uniref:hypothetical protein n=1 Tax=uncultured Tenacibaculum sp. TaxID=174713 RepID=UPI00260C80CE|nr:hypothetical protein [uncultured Tenacibaculum sp.]